MKQILIILLLVFLSSPLFGDNHKGEILYKWETSAGELWMGFGDKDTHPNYNGQVEKGEPSGLGVIYYPNGNMYIGEWKDGKPWNLTIADKNGKIIRKWDNGVEQKETP